MRAMEKGAKVETIDAGSRRPQFIDRERDAEIAITRFIETGESRNTPAKYDRKTSTGRSLVRRA
jgi:hypothetical protein